MTKTVYVCPIKGNDKNDGLEESKPVRTIARGGLGLMRRRKAA
jgi:hypothetical protein